jgi:hypothetical protein
MGVVIYTRFGSFFASRDAVMTQKKLGLVRVVQGSRSLPRDSAWYVSVSVCLYTVVMYFL